MGPQERFNLIMSRQARFRWGDTYQPSIMAVPREAPRGSRVSRLQSRSLGRTLHALSTPERVFAMLALHHPDLLDIHEQRMLWPYPAPHPLQGHPLTKGQFLTPVAGTAVVAQSIGFKHFEVTVEQPDGSRVRLPFPYQGDLLLYLAGDSGVPYAVNWSIKDRRAAFMERTLSRAKTPAQQRRDRAQAELRAQLEAHYYAGAGIRTVQLSLEDLDSCVQANLELLFPVHGLQLRHEEGLLAEFSHEIEQAVVRGDPVSNIAIKFGDRWGERDQFIARIYQDIWYRRIPVSLLEPILIDHPLNTDGGDVLDVYRGFFREETP